MSRRTSLTWRILGADLIGTCHVPDEGSADPTVGVLLVNAGPAPRSGNSDLSVRIGDRLARLGFHAFRFDLAGLGDSPGPTPIDVDSFRDAVLRGRNDEATVALIERLQVDLGFEQVVVGGLCAAALPSVRALRGRAPPAGLILLEPSFRVPVEQESGGSLRDWLSSLGRRIGDKLPKDVNVRLARRWLEGFDRGVRSLVVVADGEGTEDLVARILELAPDRARDAVTCVRVSDTNHLFTRGTGRDGVLDALESWMVESFGRKVPA